MDSRSAIFLQVMIGIAIVGLVAFLIILVGRYLRAPQTSGGKPSGVAMRARWPELLLALALALVVAVIVVWQFPPIDGTDAANKSWRSDPRAIVFFVVMLIAAGVGLLSFVFYLFARQRPAITDASAEAEPPATESEIGQHATPSSARLLGLLLLGVAILLLCWIYVPRAQQYQLMLYFVYPASFAVALVMLFDKATRAWSIKPAAANLREWLLCDAIVFLLVFGFLNLLASKAGPKYELVHWDLLHIAAFFFVFWLLDRGTGRSRFLIAYAYLIALPILLLIWQATQSVPAAKDAGWWGSIWPFFALAILFFVLEIIVLAARRGTDASALPAFKDGVFVVAYGVLLLIAQ